MTPQEKANNLVNQYRIILMREDTECGNEILCSRIAKQCALIAVDELIECSKSYDIYNATWATQIHFWNKVKQEIEKL